MSLADGYLAQEIWWAPRAGADRNGQALFGAATKLSARWVEKRRLVRSNSGEQVISETTVMLPATPAVVAGDRLSQDGSTWLVVIAMSSSVGLGGTVELRRAYI